ncbi:MAG: glycosyltransferase family 2 protein, partial [Nitrospirota bacterium]
AVSFTTQPWILVLDADERITEELKKEILNVVKNADPSTSPLTQEKRTGVEGYYLPRKNYFGERWIKHGGWWPDYTLRLFRRGRGSFEPREVHEAVKIDGPAAYFKNPLLHYTYKNTGDFSKRMETYSALAAKELFKKGRRANIFDIIFRPPATFFRMFFLQLGILDGVYGIILAYLYSVYTYKKYQRLREMQKNKK